MSQNPNPYPISSQFYSSNDPRTINTQKYDPFPPQRSMYSAETASRTTKYLSNAYDENVVPERQYQQQPSGLSEDEMKRIVSRELRGHFESLRSELLENFTVTLRQYKASSRISNEEIQEIKSEIAENKNKFENLQSHISQVNQKFTDINEHCANELDEIKTIINSRPLNNNNGGNIDTNRIIQQLEFKFQALQQNVMNDVQGAIKSRGRSKMNEGMMSELKEMKNTFEDNLKKNFDSVNIRVKGAEERLHDILKVKQDMMERTKEDVFATFEQQGVELQEEVQNLAHAVNNKCDLNQAKVVIEREVAKRIGPVNAEIDSIRQRAIEDQEDLERRNFETKERLENLERSSFSSRSQNQLAERSPNNQIENNNAIVEKRLAQLSQESEAYRKTINELRASLAEVQEVFQAIQKQAKANPANNSIISRLEAKINGLQTQIDVYSARASQNRSQQQQLQSSQSAQKTTQSYIGGTSSPFITTSASKNPQSLSSAPQFRYQSPAPKREDLVLSGLKSQDQSYNQSRTRQAENILRSPYSPHQEISVVRRPEDFEYKLKQSASVSVIENKADVSIAGSTSQRRYYGDPKVKDIIDEYHRNRKSSQVTSAANSFMRDTSNISGLPATTTSNLLGTFGNNTVNQGFSPKINVTNIGGSGITSPQAGGVQSLSAAKSHANLLANIKPQNFQQVILFN